MAKDKDKKNETILEVNEVTEETVRAEEEQKAKEEQERKEKAYNIRKEKIKKTFDKLLKGHDINLIVKIMMWVFFAFSALYVNANIFKQVLREPALKVFIAEDSLKDESRYNINEIKEIRVNLESFDVDIRETDSEDIIIRYSKKYDKKINMDKRGSILQLEEKNKVFKLVRFDTSNNLYDPPLGSLKPVRSLIIVVLPAPFSPTKPKIDPSGTNKLTLSTTVLFPYFFVRFLTSIIFILRL